MSFSQAPAQPTHIPNRKTNRTYIFSSSWDLENWSNSPTISMNRGKVTCTYIYIYLIHQASCQEGDISVQPSPCNAAIKNCELHWIRNCQKDKKAHTDRTTHLNRFGSTVDGLTTGQMSCGRQRGVANHWAMNDVNCWHLVSGRAFDRPENVRMERSINSVKIQAIYWQCNTHLVYTHDSSKWRQMETTWSFRPSTNNVTHVTAQNGDKCKQCEDSGQLLTM